MHLGIGETLREARNRRRVGLTEVEAATKIRVRYLQALENEEWDVLPGGAYTRGFIRTYASYLGLDGDRLAEEYRRATASPADQRAPRVEPAATGSGGAVRRRWAPTRTVVALIVAALLAAAVVIGLLGGDDNQAAPGTPREERPERKDSGRRSAPAPGRAAAVDLQLTAQAEVWVCLLDATGTRLIDGQILQEGAEAGPFRSTEFSVSFGNGSLALSLDGGDVAIPASASPLGYRIDTDGLTRLSEAERPTCT